MRRLLVSGFVAAVCLVPSLANAESKLLSFGPPGSVAIGTLTNGPSHTATYRTELGWIRYPLEGPPNVFASETVFPSQVWLTAAGEPVHRDASGAVWLGPEGQRERLLGPGDACPDGSGSTVSYLDVRVGTSVGPAPVVHALVDCGNHAGIYALERDAMTPVAVPDMPMPGFPDATGQPKLGSIYTNVMWTMNRVGEVVVSARVYDCEPDPNCTNGGAGTFRLGSSAEALYVEGGDAPGLPPEYRGTVLAHPRVNDSGDVAFMPVGVGDVPLAIFVRSAGGQYREVATPGGAAPGTGTSFGGFELSHFDIDTQGHVSFVANAAQTTLWHETDAGVQRVVWPGMEIPGAPESSVVEVLAATQSPSGRLAAIVVNGAGPLRSSLVVAEDEDGELGVAWAGDLIEGEEFDGLPYFDGDGLERVGRGLVFSDDGKLAMGITGGTRDAAIIVDVDDNGLDLTEVDIDFVLHDQAPVYWGQTLSMDAVVSNFDDSAVQSFDVRIDFSPAISEPQVDCEGSTYDAAASRLTIDCAGEGPMQLPNGRDVGFSIRTPVSTTDATLTLEALVATEHEDGGTGLQANTWTFELLATPEGTDLAVSVDDPIAATSMRVDNLGPRPATGVVLQARLDDGAGHFSIPEDSRCTREGEQLLLTCNVGDLDDGQSIEIAFPPLSDGSGTLTVVSDQPDFEPDNDESRFTLLIEIEPDAAAPGCGDCRVGTGSRGRGAWLWLLLMGLRRRRASARRVA